MRLNRNTYPSYYQLVDNVPYKLMVDEAFRLDKNLSAEVMSDIVLGCFGVYNQVANRYYITEPFNNALLKSLDKIEKDYLHLNYDKPDCGIYFTQNGFTLYLANPTDKNVKLVCYGFNRNGLTSFGTVTSDLKSIGMYYMKNEKGEIVNDKARLGGWLNSILACHYFINNCEIETKIVAPSKKERDANVKFYNESKSPFTILNCNWFTNLVRDTPFSVKGHLRWQPCGEGHKKRKLIWIDEFEKSGYKRNAQKQTA